MHALQYLPVVDYYKASDCTTLASAWTSEDNPASTALGLAMKLSAWANYHLCPHIVYVRFEHVIGFYHIYMRW